MPSEPAPMGGRDNKKRPAAAGVVARDTASTELSFNVKAIGQEAQARGGQRQRARAIARLPAALSTSSRYKLFASPSRRSMLEVPSRIR